MTEIPDDIRATVKKLYEPYSYLADGPDEGDIAKLLKAERMSWNGYVFRAKDLDAALRRLIMAVEIYSDGSPLEPGSRLDKALDDAKATLAR